ADRVLSKPEAPHIPTASTLLAEAQNGPGPVVAYTYTDHGSSRAVYAVAFRRGDAASAALKPSETGLTDKVFAYDVRHRYGAVVDASATISLDLSQDWTSVVLVPVSRSGIAIVGDTGKFVPRGRARIADLTDRGEAVDVEVAFAAGENSVTLTGYSPGSPQVLARSGQIVKVSWSSSTGLFELVIAPGANATARVTISS